MKHFIFPAALVALLAAAPAPAAAQDTQSGPAVATLTATLERLKLDAIVARDPEQPGQYVAALYIPGTQLLVVSAPYAAPALLDKKIAAGDYRDAYVDLQSVADHRGHFFVIDMQANGLVKVCGRDEPSDSTTFEGNVPMSYDGKWVEQKLTEEEYNVRFSKDDERYARMLKVLNTAVARKITEP